MDVLNFRYKAKTVETLLIRVCKKKCDAFYNIGYVLLQVASYGKNIYQKDTKFNNSQYINLLSYKEE